jgi:hypothetical protein
MVKQKRALENFITFFIGKYFSNLLICYSLYVLGWYPQKKTYNMTTYLVLLLFASLVASIQQQIPMNQCIKMESGSIGLQSSDAMLTLGVTGELEIYRHSHSVQMKSGLSQSNQLVWRSLTAGLIFKYPAELCMQTDGNLVLYDADRYAIWATGTTGRRNVHAALVGSIFQLISDTQVIWSSANSNGYSRFSISLRLSLSLLNDLSTLDLQLLLTWQSVMREYLIMLELF